MPDGQLTLSWQLSPEGDCVLSWREAGGPEVAMPTRSGFGSKLIQTTMDYDLGGSAKVAYNPSGLEAHLVIPASHLVASEDVQPSAISEAARPTHDVLAGLDVLLVEDQALIAMDTEDTLRKLGAANVRLAANVAAARRELLAARPDFAILDFNLGNETSADIADALQSSSVPFLFVTGYGDNVIIPERFKQVPVARKPVSATSLSARIEAVRRSPT